MKLKWNLKTILKTLIIFLLTAPISAQSIFLTVSGKTAEETKIIDSLQYSKIQFNAQTATQEITVLTNKLLQLGYINNEISLNPTSNKDTLYYKINLNNQIKNIHIYIVRNKEEIKLLFPKGINDTVLVPYPKIDQYLQLKYNELAALGKPFTKIKLENIQQRKNYLIAELIIKSEQTRIINAITYNFSDPKKSNTLPKAYQKFISKKFVGRDYTKKNIEKINKTLSAISFVTSTKHPEALFKKDSTLIYTYLEKKNSSNFDGYIGFNTDENKKLRLNGYLDIQLENIMHAGEEFSLYWKNDGKERKTFDTQLEIPFVFGTPFLIKGVLNIFTQDSTFQNTKIAATVGYIINLDSKIKLQHQTTQSSNIQNINSSIIKDYQSKFNSLNYTYIKQRDNDSFLNNNTSLDLDVGYGVRTTNKSKSTQKNFKTDFSYTFTINPKNYFGLRNLNYLLISNNYLTNELYRFGGVKSIRGFSENSIQANYVSYITTEYLYIVNSNLYLNSVLDFGVYVDKTVNMSKGNQKTLKSFGIEINLKTKSNIVKISLANGSSSNEKIELSNTILNICYNVKF
ncbi:Outer membrane protein/protective antigen OMA87 [Flavobacterium sp. TAB 87]|nr:Outer membrane protein/protective antigen OMA87 [Flavobacterium sp. TAB 87]